MPAIPLPFVTAIMLVMVFIRLAMKRDRALRPALFFIVACIAMVTLVGLRWSGNFQHVRQLQPILACTLPLLAWHSFRSLISVSKWRFWVLFGLIIIATGGLVFFPLRNFPVDYFIATLSLLFGVALIRIANRGADIFSLSRLSEAPEIQKVASLVGVLLCFSGIGDLVIAFDFTLYAGQHVLTMVITGQLFVLIFLATLLVKVGQSQPVQEGELKQAPETSQLENVTETSQVTNVEEDNIICQKVNDFIIAQRLYRDPDLTLERLARKVLIPGRRISQAINRVQNRNVSQMINSYRIVEAQRLLKTTSLTVTEIMDESGFRTKSNFNREFLRTAGMNPGEYRRACPPEIPETL
ncbi:helix-turn-helix transcriptional regulator [Erwinia pyri]|uniref:Helix-turn-helix transcriptional regulator n=1 Tax=Erwinia pyri TaxID=3062598 RepID=A0AA50DFA1_9GAMM|nr:helix-turn-helix transcriptional regulator [Erwinia sp. DE2]WLS77279.1 helix-turn-helix transcriptional regulator [Erwinia sp. DE2]